MLLKTYRVKNHIVNQYSITVGKKVVFARSLGDDSGWVRVFGKGIGWTKQPLFGISNGYKKSLKIKGYYITFV